MNRSLVIVVGALILAAPFVVWCVNDYQRFCVNQELWNKQAWEGYYYSAVNYRFYLERAEQGKEDDDFANEWRQLETRYQYARDHWRLWTEAERRGRFAELKARKDDIEAREPPESTDEKLMGEVQDDFNEFLGIKDT